MGMSFLNSLNQMSFSDCTNIYRSQDHVTVDCNFLSDPGQQYAYIESQTDPKEFVHPGACLDNTRAAKFGTLDLVGCFILLQYRNENTRNCFMDVWNHNAETGFPGQIYRATNAKYHICKFGTSQSFTGFNIVFFFFFEPDGHNLHVTD